MFIRLVDELIRQGRLDPQQDWAGQVDRAFCYRPVDLLWYLETYWAAVRGAGRDYVGGSGQGDEEARRALAEPARVGLVPNKENVRPPVPNAGKTAMPDPDNFPDPSNPTQVVRPVWKHLIYAYAVENTRVFDILRRVLREILTGERLGRPNAVVLSWARTTEELFFTDRLGHWVLSPVSRLRDDGGAIRRNAYYRMFGMDLNHASEDNRPYPYPKPEAANREFARTFEQLLRETWRGYVDRRNYSGPNMTDDATLFDLTLRLRDMLRDRRIYGALAREEFYSVATLSWFHLTVSANNALVTLMQAQGNNAAERLRAIGERVGLPAHSRSYNYFEMADALSDIVCRIEYGQFNTIADVQQLYDLPPNLGGPPNLTDQMLTIINHWSAASGRNLKEFAGAPDLATRRG